jgi:trimethylamine monooxygenase
MKSFKTNKEIFTHIIDATGHFSGPNIPFIYGIESFVGTVIHAYEFVPDEKILSGKNILLVGNKYSVIDIGSKCNKLGCLSLTFCDYHAKQCSTRLHCHMTFEVKCYIKSISKNEVMFEDGTIKNVDIIIFCTRSSYNRTSFNQVLSDSTEPHNKFYKNIVSINNSKLMYLGILHQVLLKLISQQLVVHKVL